MVSIPRSTSRFGSIEVTKSWFLTSTWCLVSSITVEPTSMLHKFLHESSKNAQFQDTGESDLPSLNLTAG